MLEKHNSTYIKRDTLYEKKIKQKTKKFIINKPIINNITTKYKYMCKICNNGTNDYDEFIFLHFTKCNKEIMNN